MALLNPPNILPELGFVVHRLLAANGGKMDWASMYTQLVPNPSVFRSTNTDPTVSREANDPLNQTIRALADIGFLELEGGVIILSKPTPPPSSRDEDRRRFITSLLQCVMADAVGREERWGKDAPGALDLTRSLSFTLLQDPHRAAFFRGSSSKVHPDIERAAVDLERERIDHIGTGDDDAQVLHNDERWHSFTRWAVTLGFGDRIPPSSRASSSQQVLFRIDPTRAIGLTLETITPGNYPILEFLEELSHRLPVIPPFGELYKDLVGHWVGSLPIGESEIPPTVSNALRTLEHQERLRFGRGADAPEVARLIIEYPHERPSPVAEQVARVQIP